MARTVLVATTLVYMMTCAPTSRNDAPGQLAASARNHTPGFFRATFQQLQAQEPLNNSFAAKVLRTHLDAEPELPGLLRADVQTFAAMHAHARRSVAAVPDDAAATRAQASLWLDVMLGLDPALDALAEQGWIVAVTEPGAATFARASLRALAGLGEGAHCARASFSTASWDRGPPEVVWVDEICTPDESTGGYCEPDIWRDGDCRDEWIAEQCSGGRWVDRGYYEYICRGDDCRYEWRKVMQYEDGDCSGGYYRRECDSGYWERGLCYDGTLVRGYCVPGHYEYRYPGGTWTYPAYLAAPAQCTTVRPGQKQIAYSALEALREHLDDNLAPEWQAAAARLAADIAAADGKGAAEQHLGAIVQVLEAVSR